MPSNANFLRGQRKAFAGGRRIKTPTVLQMEATECGAAALAIILGYYGRFAPLEALRIDCGVSRNGSQAINILKAARHHGMHAKGAKVEDIARLSTLRFPLILHWEFDHFVVLEGIRDGRFYLNDPAAGRHWVDYGQFNRSFTGIVLILEPGPEFERQGTGPSLLTPLMARLAGSAVEFGFVIMATLALTVPGLLVAGISKVFVDEVLVQGISDWTYLLVLGLILTALLRGLLTWLEETALMRLETKLSLIHTATFLWHILHLPVSFHSQRYIGDIGERIEANERIASLISGEVTGALVALIRAFLYAAVMFLLAWQIGLVAVLAACLTILAFLAVAGKIGDKSRLLLQRQGHLAGVEANGLLSIEALKGAAWEDVFFKHWAGGHTRTLNTQQQLETYDTSIGTVAGLLNGLSSVFVIGYGSLLIMQGEMSVGTLVALQSLLASVLAPVLSLVGLGQQAQEIRGDLMRLQDGLAHPLDPYYGHKEVRPSDATVPIDRLRVVGLAFGYTPVDPPVLENVSFSLERGKRVAVVGTTGSGKSTLARVLCRCYTPWSGDILCDDAPIDSVSPERLAQSLAYVDQDTCLFEGTVVDNLGLWSPEVDEEQVQQAVSDACLDEVLAGRGGLQCLVREGGANFSGGERQRLEIARALLGAPSLLVLDEATGSLDAVIEHRIYANIRRRGCGLLVITHRLNVLRAFDEILVMSAGRIVERGTHAYLIARGGVYGALYGSEDGADG